MMSLLVRRTAWLLAAVACCCIALPSTECAVEVEGDGGRKFEVVEGFNAVPRGLSEGALSLEECMSICDKHNCTQFSFNELFRVCYYSNLTTWQGLVNATWNARSGLKALAENNKKVVKQLEETKISN